MEKAHRKGLGLIAKVNLARSVFSTALFKNSVRPELYRIANHDPEVVHEIVLNEIRNSKAAVRILSSLFKADKELMVKVNGREVVPFGNAAGFDKDGDALEPLSNFFGFLEPGTVVLNPRPGNDRPRIAVDEQNLEMWNAQGFPSRGLEYFMKNLIAYKESGGKKPVYVSVCGLPVSESNAVEVAMREMETLLKRMAPYADGFVWNPASPNTAALKLLRTPEVFRQTAELMKRIAPDKLILVKMWPYEDAEKHQFMGFVKGFVEGGGDGAVVTNTKMFPKESIHAKEWGYPSGGRSGKFLKHYMLRAVRDMRIAFPGITIVATGGIHTGKDAYEAFSNGANMVEGYTPYTFYGLGLLMEIEKGVMASMKRDGFGSMEELQARASENAAAGKLG
ncbi:MAG: hypothetical protein KGH50_00440 [Candidatus Micrarchaeota archaeon]|nr:hypothetical protein [Candidatus Micrarchaeota archaeon]